MSYVELIKCGCGCGETRAKYDNRGRVRNYIHGHTNRKHHTLEARLRQKRLHKKAVWQARKIQYVIHLGGACLHCGLKYDGKNAALFDFHHRDPSTKDFTIRSRWDLSKVLPELEKCDVLCANCHRLHHAEEY
jgi:hypothetical protein